MRIGRFITFIAIATVCVLVFVQGGVADAATSASQQRTERHASPAPLRQTHAFGTASTVPLEIVDTRYAAGAATPTSL